MSEQSGWMPIETAPRDGSLFRVKDAHGRETVGEYWEPPPIELGPEQTFGGFAFDIAPFMESADWPEYEPSHWMPLPSPPKEPTP